MFFIIMLCPSPIGIRHEVLAIAQEAMQQSAMAGRVGLTDATVSCILQRHAATGNLVPGKSTGVPHKTTPRQDCALGGMVQQYRSSGLNNVDEEFVWNEGLPESHQQSALVLC